MASKVWKIPVHYREDTYLDKVIKEKFSTCLMNDSKWVKLISTFVMNVNIIKECRVHPIWENDSKSIRRLVFDENTSYNFDYYNTAMESMISGNPTGWYAYKEIEWLDFSKTVISNTKNQIITEQNLELIKSKIEKIGQFYLELSNDNLRLYAYLRK